jgi:dTDP-4-amino-4,6-dideoxy-D-galactose acyltransferase
MKAYDSLGWDSEFFGFAIGRVESGVAPGDLAEAVAAADGDGIRCLYLLCPGDDDGLLASALNLGFRPYDVRVELDHRIGAPPVDATSRDSGVREAMAYDEATLQQIVRTRMSGTRFWNDPRFPRARVADLYAAWLRRGLTTPPDRLTLVTDGAEGFIICHLDREAGVGSIELIAVAATVERRGLGGELVIAADRAFSAAGMTRATVVTQSRNIAAQRLYQRCGYRTARSDFWLHRWVD